VTDARPPHAGRSAVGRDSRNRLESPNGRERREDGSESRERRERREDGSEPRHDGSGREGDGPERRGDGSGRRDGAELSQDALVRAGDDEEARRRVIRRRAFTLLTIVLLIGIPAGYLLISGAQSRDSGKDKEARYSATGLTWGWPSKVQRRIYEVPIPHPAELVAQYETNNWRTSRLHVQFLTTEAGLDAFLRSMGVTRDDLEKDAITIAERDRHTAGWEFKGPGPWYGLTRAQEDPLPSQNVVVNLSDPDNPMVYVVSRTTP
jgi:hypothetical protein